MHSSADSSAFWLSLVMESSLPSHSHVNDTPLPATAAQHVKALETRFSKTFTSFWLAQGSQKAVFSFYDTYLWVAESPWGVFLGALVRILNKGCL